MPHNSEPRIKPMHIWLINVGQNSQDYTVEKGQSINGVGKLDSTCKRMKSGHYFTPSKC